MSDGRRLDSFSGGLDEFLERLVDEKLRKALPRALREAMRDAPGSAPKFTSLSAHARSRGLGVSTLRRWARALGVQRQPGGKFLSAELDAAIERAGIPAPVEPVATVDLAAARARRAVDSLVGRGRS